MALWVVLGSREETRLAKGKKPFSMEEAVRAHMSFCGKFKSNLRFELQMGLRQMLRRRSDMSMSSPSSSSSSSSSSLLFFFIEEVYKIIKHIPSG
ncbi:hypothetical protein M0R45_020470 [Rubus argutus]|uniref:Uncharacterized protein n=1 Tax=Rubus argutus TaxID=59490 RepID=A0AAW1XAU0_RUBAR